MRKLTKTMYTWDFLTHFAFIGFDMRLGSVQLTAFRVHVQLTAFRVHAPT